MCSRHFCSSKNTSLYAKGFRERAEFKINLTLEFEMVDNAATSFAKDTLSVAVIDQNHRPKLFCKFVDFIEWSIIPVHREHPIGNDEFPICIFMCSENGFEFAHVVVSVNTSSCFCQSHTIDDGTVINSSLMITSCGPWTNVGISPTFAVYPAE